MTIREAAAQLTFLRSENKMLWPEDIAACDAAVTVLTALREEGADTLGGAVGRIRSYPIVAAKCRELKAHFETGGTPVRIAGTRCCPKCHEPVGMKHKYCPWCGKRLIGRWEKL